MSEATLTSPQAIAGLQSMLHELYALREHFSNAVFSGNVAYTGSNPVFDLSKVTGTASGLGYVTGSGGAVTQATSKSTAVTLNKAAGSVLMNAATLATLTSVQFAVNNSLVAATDVVIANVSQANGVTGGNNYTLTAYAVTAGQFSLRLRNDSGGPLAETVLINFAVIKAVTS